MILSFCRWEGEGLNEVGKEKATGIVRVRIKEKFFRPSEVVSSK
jgi:GDPmannose 4,6-dehydratase